MWLPHTKLNTLEIDIITKGQMVLLLEFFKIRSTIKNLSLNQKVYIKKLLEANNLRYIGL